MKISKHTHSLSAVMCMAAATFTQAQITATFDSTGTDTSDQYVGTSGNGWVGAWTQATRTGNNSATQTVSISSPLSGAGSLFIQSTRSNDFNGAASRSNVTREWEAVGGLSPSAPFTVSFDFRLDAMEGSNAFGDYVAFFMDDAANSSGNFNNSAGGFRIVGDLSFQVRNGDNTPTITTLAIGSSYSFSADIDPTTNTWSFSLTGSGVDESATGLAFGGASTTAQFVHLGSSIQTDPFEIDPVGLPDVQNAWTVDNLEIAAIPEPSTYAALFGALGLALVIARRRKR